MIAKLILSAVRVMASAIPTPIQKALFRFPPFTWLAHQITSRISPSGLIPFAVTAGALAGRTLMLDLINDVVYWRGQHDQHLQSALVEKIKAGMIVYDAGANIGYHTLLMADLVGSKGHVYAFEPLPTLVERLHTNLKLNPDLSNITVIPKAVSNNSEPIDFLVHESIMGGKMDISAGLPDEAFVANLTVPSISLDQFAYQEGHPAPQVVKLDIQGGEVLALPGMQRILDQAKPLIFIEMHGTEAIQSCWERLTGAGYEILTIEPGYAHADAARLSPHGVQLMAVCLK